MSFLHPSCSHPSHASSNSAQPGVVRSIWRSAGAVHRILLCFELQGPGDGSPVNADNMVIDENKYGSYMYNYYVNIKTCVYVYVYIYIYMYICISIYTKLNMYSVYVYRYIHWLYM